MSVYRDKAQKLRDQITPHINCAQAVLVPFAKAAGISEEAALRIAGGFAGGMKRGSVCGAVTGGIMVLGLFGLADPDSLEAFHRRLKEAHEGMYDCRDLLRLNEEAGGIKKPFCDGLVGECVDLVAEMLEEKGLLK